MGSKHSTGNPSLKAQSNNLKAPQDKPKVQLDNKPLRESEHNSTPFMDVNLEIKLPPAPKLIKEAKNVIRINCSEGADTGGISFMFINREDLNSSFLLQLPMKKGNPKLITILQQLSSREHFNRTLKIEGTYHTNCVDINKPITYFADCQPLYFTFPQVVKLPVEFISKDNTPTSNKLSVSFVSKESGANIHKLIREHFKLGSDASPYKLNLQKPTGELLVIPNQWDFILDSNKDDLSNGQLIVSDLAPEISFTVNTLRKKERTIITCSPDVFGYQLKVKLQKQLHIPTENQDIIFRNSKLEDYKTLGTAGIHEGAKLFVIIKFPPSPTVMVLLKQKNKPLRVEPFSETALEWQKIYPGLCIKGICSNKACAAVNQKVIVNLGFTMFDIIADRQRCKCPQCDRIVEPDMLWVYKSAFIFSAVKNYGQDNCQRLVDQAWRIQYGIGFQYQIPKPTAQPGWTHRKIITRDICLEELSRSHNLKEGNDALKVSETETVACVVCKKGVDIKMRKECHHAHHDECYSQLSKVISSKCLLCAI